MFSNDIIWLRLILLQFLHARGFATGNIYIAHVSGLGSLHIWIRSFFGQSSGLKIPLKA
jgi:hypothetical protein